MTCDLYYISRQLGPSQTRKPDYVTYHVQKIGWNPGSDPSSDPGSDPSSNPGSKFRYPRVSFLVVAVVNVK